MTTEPYVEPENRIRQALELISRYGGIDGAHHKQWVLDQVVRALVTRSQLAAEIRGLAATQKWGPEHWGTWQAACETIARLVEEGGSRE